jgi:hypothetical protein
MTEHWAGRDCVLSVSQLWLSSEKTLHFYSNGSAFPTPPQWVIMFLWSPPALCVLLGQLTDAYYVVLSLVTLLSGNPLQCPTPTGWTVPFFCDLL